VSAIVNAQQQKIAPKKLKQQSFTKKLINARVQLLAPNFNHFLRKCELSPNCARKKMHTEACMALVKFEPP
jgi:hypothetical protein